MVLSYTYDFQVTWQDPAHGNESWIHDRLHTPWVLPPLTQALVERVMKVAFGVPTVFVNGYGFMRDLSPPLPTPDIEARGAIPVWQEDFAPHIRLACQEMRNRDYDSLTNVELAERMPQYFVESAEAFRYTMLLTFAFLRPTASLIAFLEEQLDGQEQAGFLAARLLQGFDNESTAVDVGLDELTVMALASPSLSQALAAGHYKEIPSVDGGPEFLHRLREYIAEYGWRSESWYLAHIPVWAEDERLPMALIGRYVADPSRSLTATLERSATIRKAATAEAEARLPTGTLPRFHELVAACHDYVAISESRVRWQLEICGSVRVPILTLGRRLVATGAIEEPNDIFYLTMEDIQQVAHEPSASRKAEVALAKAEARRCERLTPPAFLGAAPSMSKAPPDLQGLMRHLRGYGIDASNDTTRIKGLGASKGSARGKARVIFGLEDGTRLERGDILVCRTTAPPWTSLFAIAGGIVSDAGGVLSHTAICAREFGIPAVVATQVGTTQIPDGAWISIDGEKGIVTIET